MNLSPREIKLSLICQIFQRLFGIARETQNGNEKLIPEIVLNCKIGNDCIKTEEHATEEITLEGTQHPALARFSCSIWNRYVIVILLLECLE